MHEFSIDTVCVHSMTQEVGCITNPLKNYSILLEIIKVDNKMLNRLNFVKARIKMPLKRSNRNPSLPKKMQARYSNPTGIIKYSTTQKIWQMPQAGILSKRNWKKGGFTTRRKNTRSMNFFSRNAKLIYMVFFFTNIQFKCMSDLV